MSQLILRELNANDENVFFEGLKDWQDEDLSWYTFVWRPGMSFNEHLEILSKNKDKNQLAQNRVSSTMLYAFVGSKIIGRLSVRHELNHSLLERGGHMGYSVSPLQRNKGYATEIYKQGLLFCKNLGLEKILVTCGDKNIGSWKVIEKFSAHLENRFFDQQKDEYVRRYWINIHDALNDSVVFSNKSIAYITRTQSNTTEILVFDHDQIFLDAGTQVISGTVDKNETPEQALLREIKEESGLNHCFNISKIDEYLFFADWSKKYVKRHVYRLTTDFPILNSWTHTVDGDGEDKYLNFHFYWIDLEDSKSKLSARLGDSIFKFESLM